MALLFRGRLVILEAATTVALAGVMEVSYLVSCLGIYMNIYDKLHMSLYCHYFIADKLQFLGGTGTLIL